jgi:hypothetical protein
MNVREICLLILWLLVSICVSAETVSPEEEKENSAQQQRHAAMMKEFLSTVEKAFPFQDNELVPTNMEEFDQTFQQARDQFIDLAVQICADDHSSPGRYEQCSQTIATVLEDALLGEHDQATFAFFFMNMFVSGAEIPLMIVLELYKQEHGHYPETLGQLFPVYFQDTAAYTPASGDIEASYGNFRYYPPHKDQEEYTLLYNFPGNGTPNIGLLREQAKAVAPLIEAIEMYACEQGHYPEKLVQLFPDYFPHREQLKNYVMTWNYTSPDTTQRYSIYTKFHWDISLWFDHELDQGRWTYCVSDVPPRHLELDFEFPTLCEMSNFH